MQLLQFYLLLICAWQENISIHIGTSFSVWYLEKDIQNIQDIPKNIQYKEIAGLFIPPNTFLQKLDVYGSKTFKKSIVLKLWSLISTKPVFPKTTESDLFEP